MRVLHKLHVFVISARNFWVGIKYVVLLDNLCKFSPQKICCYPSLNDVGTLDGYISTFGHRTPLESFDDKLHTHTHRLSPSPSLQKVDMYSLGIILFEMCHPPCSTSMERHKLMAGVRRKEILFPPGFTTEAGREKQVQLYYTTMSYQPSKSLQRSIKGVSSIFLLLTGYWRNFICHGCQCIYRF